MSHHVEQFTVISYAIFFAERTGRAIIIKSIVLILIHKCVNTKPKIMPCSMDNHCNALSSNYIKTGPSMNKTHNTVPLHRATITVLFQPRSVQEADNPSHDQRTTGRQGRGVAPHTDYQDQRAGRWDHNSVVVAPKPPINVSPGIPTSGRNPAAGRRLRL